MKTLLQLHHWRRSPHLFPPLRHEAVSQSPKVALSSRTNVRDLRFLAALEMTNRIADGFLPLRHSLRAGEDEGGGTSNLGSGLWSESLSSNGASVIIDRLKNFRKLRKFPVACGYPKQGFARAKHVLSLVEGTPRTPSPEVVISTEGRNLS